MYTVVCTQHKCNNNNINNLGSCPNLVATNCYDDGRPPASDHLIDQTWIISLMKTADEGLVAAIRAKL